MLLCLDILLVHAYEKNAYEKNVLIVHNFFNFHYCGWNVPWTCFHNTYPIGSPVWFCSFLLWLIASSSTDIWHHNGSSGNTRPPINMRHGPGDRALWERRRGGERLQVGWFLCERVRVHVVFLAPLCGLNQLQRPVMNSVFLLLSVCCNTLHTL